MELKIKFLVLMAAISFSSYSEIKLTEFITKQDKRNIRYIDNEGTITYYQRSNGSLQLATNYKVTPLLQLEEKTQYLVRVTSEKNFIAVQANTNFHDYFSTRYLNNLYIAPYGKIKSKEIGKGILTGLHGDKDKWISFFNPFTKKIHIKSTENKNIKHEIKIASLLNPYYIPKVYLIKKDLFAFTDVNKEGIPGVRTYNIISKKSSVLYKSLDQNSKLDICVNKNDLYIWESSHNEETKGTRITSIPKRKFAISEQKFVYQSKENDIGSLKCEFNDGNIYFIKTIQSSTGKKYYEAARHAIKQEKTHILSSLKFATSLIVMDKRLLIPYQGKFYTLLSNGDTTKLDALNNKEGM
jgi:hypothetical protein